MASNGNLIASHPGNVSALRHCLYSDRVLAPRIKAYRERLLATKACNQPVTAAGHR